MKFFYIIGLSIFFSFNLCGAKPVRIIGHIDNSSFHSSRHLRTEGSRGKVIIDTISTIAQLIQQLEGNWKFTPTGKMYWIGYTPTMFSIAERKDSAIQPLLNFIDTCKNEHAKYGAIYTLHLIGINSEIKGRFHEDFSNVNARTALLSLLRRVDLQPVVVELLIRDHHFSDIPGLFETLIKSDSDCWAINNYLTCFYLPIPINQDLSADSFKQYIEIDYSEELRRDFEKQLPIIVAELAKQHFDDVFVDTMLLKGELWGRMRSGNLIRYDQPIGKIKIFVSDFLNAITSEDYTNIGSHIQYYIENRQLHICTQATAKARLIDWWLCMSPEERRLASEKK